jgi:hypothetical protein
LVFKVVRVNEAILVIIFILLTGFIYGQDCCGPGGGGGTAFFTAGEAGTAGYRIKNTRRYAYSARHPGFTAGFEGGGITNTAQANISPRLEYSGSFGSFDVYGGAFYSVFFDKPHSHQIGLAENPNADRTITLNDGLAGYWRRDSLN